MSTSVIILEKTTVLTLSEEAKKVLKFKANQSSKTQSEMLEWIIMFFAVTSKEEKEKWKEKKERARSAFLKENFPISAQAQKLKIFEKTWNDGFTEGWLQFQTRNSFVKNSPKGIKRKLI